MSNPFTLKDGIFYRDEDGKDIARLVDGEIVGLHHKQKKFLPELEKLVSPVTDEEPEQPEEVEEEPAKPASEDQTPRELFKPMTGSVTPEVIEWRRENWTEEQFNEAYDRYGITYKTES